MTLTVSATALQKPMTRNRLKMRQAKERFCFLGLRLSGGSSCSRSPAKRRGSVRFVLPRFDDLFENSPINLILARYVLRFDEEAKRANHEEMMAEIWGNRKSVAFDVFTSRNDVR